MKFMILPISNQNLMKKKSNATLYLIISIFVGGGGDKGDKMKYNNWQS